MAMYAKIRRMYFREHLTISEIQRRTSLSRNTIKKWLRGGDEPHQQRRNRDSKLTPYEPLLKLALETDAHRPKRDRRTAKRLFETIRQEGYTGGYSQLTDFIRRTRRHATSTGKSAFVPLKFQLGEAFQFDWSEEWLMIGGIHRKILAAHTKLCASRAFLLSGYLPGHCAAQPVFRSLPSGQPEGGDPPLSRPHRGVCRACDRGVPYAAAGS